MKKLPLIICILSVPLAYCFANEQLDTADMDSFTLPEIVNEFIKNEDSFNDKYGKKTIIVHHAGIKKVRKEKDGLYLDLDWYASGKTDKSYGDINKGDRISFIGYYDMQKNASGYPVFIIAKLRKESEKNEDISAQETIQEEQPPLFSLYGDKPFIYKYYANVIIRKIARYWIFTDGDKKLKAVASFTIAKDGTVEDKSILLTESSGNIDFDKTALTAIKKAAPFPPLPEEYKENSATIHFEFKFRN